MVIKVAAQASDWHVLGVTWQWAVGCEAEGQWQKLRDLVARLNKTMPES